VANSPNTSEIVEKETGLGNLKVLSVLSIDWRKAIP